MKFEHLKLDNSLDWNGGVAELVIESPKFLREILRDFSVDGEDKDGAFLEERGKVLSMVKEVDFIANPLCLDFGNRQATTALIKLLAKSSVAEDNYLSTNKLKTKIIQYINELVDAENFMFEVDVGDFSMADIAKAVSVHVVGDEDDFVELITDYMAMMNELAGIKVFVVLNLRMLVSNDELAIFRDNMNNHELNVMLIEGKDFGCVDGIDRLLIDADLCEI